MRTLKTQYLSIVITFFIMFFSGKTFAFSSSKIIYLTFDADMTRYMRKEQELGLVKKWYDPALIKYLENNKIPATFFATGMFAEMYPDLIKRIAANPNFSIQNHTYDHRAFEPRCFRLPVVASEQQKKEEIRKTQNIIKSLTGHNPTYFRYPGLCHSARDDSLVAAEGLFLATGEIISGDAYLKKPKTVVQHTLDNLKRGNVIVFHMGTIKSPATTDAVKLLVPRLKKMGYVFDRL